MGHREKQWITFRITLLSARDFISLLQYRISLFEVSQPGGDGP
jgi:hypothetical protein